MDLLIGTALTSLAVFSAFNFLGGETKLSLKIDEIFAKKKYNLRAAQIQKAVEAVKQGDIHETEIDYDSLEHLVRAVSMLLTPAKVQSRFILKALQAEKVTFPKPRLKLVRVVLNWVEGWAILSQTEVTALDFKNRTVAYHQYQDAKKSLSLEAKDISLESKATIKQAKAQALEAVAGKSVLDNRKNFSITAPQEKGRGN